MFGGARLVRSRKCFNSRSDLVSRAKIKKNGLFIANVFVSHLFSPTEKNPALVTFAPSTS